MLLDSGPDPSCAAKVDTPEERNQVYGDRPEEQGCIDPGGGIRGKRVGRARLGDSRDRVRARLGPPTYARKNLDAWCLVGKGELRVAFSSKEVATAILTSGRGQSMNGVARGDRVRRARRLLDITGWVRIPTVGHVLIASRARKEAWVGVRGRRVRWVLIGDTPAGARPAAAPDHPRSLNRG